MNAAAQRIAREAAVRDVRAGARAEAARRSSVELRVVPPPRGRAAVRVAAGAFVVVFGLMLVVTVFQTRLAEQQLRIDQTEDRVDLARARFAELRKENASLRSPARIASEAAALGLGPARSGGYLTLDPAIVAGVAVAAGDGLDPAGIGGAEDPFDVHKAVKRVVSGLDP
jgi:hypothetical protein